MSPSENHKSLSTHTNTMAWVSKTSTNSARVATMRRKWRPVALMQTDSKAKGGGGHKVNEK